MANHGGHAANTKIEWYFWNGDDSVLKRAPDELYGTQATGLFLAYRTVVSILKGEEVTIDYGDEWQAQWYAHLRNKATGQLRAGIEAPPGLFPDHWK